MMTETPTTLPCKEGLKNPKLMKLQASSGALARKTLGLNDIHAATGNDSEPRSCED